MHRVKSKACHNTEKASRFYQKYSHPVKSVAKVKTKALSNGINDFPNELLAKIITYLDVNTLLCATCVCRNWKMLCEDNILWHRIFKHYLDDGPNSAYVKLRRMKLVEKQCEVNWKKEFFAHCHSRNRRIISKLKKSGYTGVTDDVGKLLTKYKVQFELCLTDSNDNEHTFTSRPSCSRKASTICQWDSLDGFPNLLSIKKSQVFALTPLVLRKDKELFQGGPTQRSLIQEEEFDRKLREKNFTLLSSDDKITLKKTKVGLIFATWKDSNDIAFVLSCLHHYQLMQKCFLSSSKKIYFLSHQTVPDDIDRRYGLHGYTCYMNLHTWKKTLWEDKFSYLQSSENPENGSLILQPEQFSIGQFKYANFAWKSELFSGTIADVAILDLVVIDSNGEVMWADTYPAAAGPISTRDVSLENPGQLYRFVFKSEPGFVSVSFSKVKDLNTPTVQLGIHTAYINQWFGTSY